MALFGRKKENTEEKKKVAEPQVVAPATIAQEKTHGVSSVNALILSRPHITEKASDMSSHGTYAFVVSPEATKQEIAKAIAQVYKVTPVKVRIVVRKSKRVMKRHGVGKRGGMKKAYVTLKKGESIEFV